MRHSQWWGKAGGAVAAYVTVAGLCPVPPAAAQSASNLLMSITDLDQSGESRAYSINNVGQVVGWASGEDTRHGAQWLGDVFSDLHGTTHLSLDQIFTMDYSEAYKISNAGQIVGTARTKIICPDEEWVISCGFILAPAVLSDFGTPYPGDALTNLWTFGDPCRVHDSAATSISNANHVVGWADVDGFGAVRAFMLRPVNGVWFQQSGGVPFPKNQLMIDLGTLDQGSTVSAAHGVNDDGWVVGYSYVSDTNTSNGEAAYHAFLVVPQGNLWFVDADMDLVNDLMIDLGTLGGNNSWARDVNNRGQIVGESSTTDRNTRAFLWEAGQMVDLGTLGGANSSAAAVNENGVVAGWAEDAEGKRQGVLWINRQIVNLNNALLSTQFKQITLSEARDVNDDMEIAGWGKLRSSEQEQGFFLKNATDAERTAHNTLVAQQAGGGSGGGSAGGSGGSSAGGSSGDGREGGSSSLTPVIGQGVVPSDSGAAPEPAAPADAGEVGPQYFGLCATGANFALLATFMGLMSMRRGVRR